MSAIAGGPWSRRGAVPTSAEAAESMVPELEPLQLEVLRVLRVRPRTADEVAAFLRREKLSIRPRCTELADAGLLVDTGERRKNTSGRSATVWAVTGMGVGVIEHYEEPLTAADIETSKHFAQTGGWL